MILVPIRARLFLAFLALGIAACPTLADDLRTVGGKTIAGTLVSADEKEIVIDAKEGAVTTPLAQVLAVDFQPVRATPVGSKLQAVRLLDDSLLYCKEVKFEPGHATLRFGDDASLKVPLSAVVWLLRDADNPALKKRFEEFLRQKVRGDRIVVLREGELNPLEGTLGDVDAQGRIEFKREGAAPLPVPLDRLHGLIFYRPESPPESAVCKVHDRDGNVLTVAKVLYKDRGWQLTTSFGAEVKLPADTIASLDFNLGKLTYLSDLEPTKIVERSGIGLVVHYRKDANLDGEPILLGQRYDKGLSMHAHTELEYDLGGKFKTLRGFLGIDTRTGGESQPLVTIYCDGEKRESWVIKPNEPKPVNLSVKDVATLRIVVSSRNELDLHDHVSFADARVSQ
jgi:hypothetical protein